MKSRLPLIAPPRPPANASASELNQGRRQVPLSERLNLGRPVVGICDHGAPEPAIRFGEQLIAALHERGRPTVAATSTRVENPTRVGLPVYADAQRLRAAGAQSVLILAEEQATSAVRATLCELPDDRIVVAFGPWLTSLLHTLVTVRISPAPAQAMRDGSIGIDVELGPGMEGAATLIGDWLARCITQVSARAPTSPT